MTAVIPSLILLASLGVGQAAMAAPLTRDETDHGNLLSLIDALGVAVKTTGWPCDKGWHGGYTYNGSELVVCANKQVPQAEKLDTIRHEAWHVYQDLRDCSLKDGGPSLPVFSAGVVDKTYLTVAAKNYEPNQVGAEAEAAWAAATFDAEQINILMYSKAKSCGYRL